MPNPSKTGPSVRRLIRPSRRRSPLTVMVGVMPGVFNLDRAGTLRSFRRLAAVDAQLALVGHGEPVPDARATLTTVAAALPV
ncbi:hypothetical protein [Nonomuraea phyllanthi]|uniref:hypothetical protein n=1 Tax=Nonomuraea phyllanthi TaxID=2219224 RepID=UPI00186ACBED|nr:hypothetical protein [Nonomuraea phyllanthi]